MLTFAIGDIHGCLGALIDLLGRIDREAGGRDHRIVCLGDLVDRGPDSAGVIRLLRERQAQTPDRVICLKGNHEDMMLKAAGRPDSPRLMHWLGNGGVETLLSFGTDDLADVPGDVLAWIASLPTVHEDARRCFVHAGLNPAFARDAQSDEDRLWIRGAFLDADHDFGRYVVHGHTPLLAGWPDIRRTRVNLDTAAAYGGRLSAGVFTDEESLPVAILQAG